MGQTLHWSTHRHGPSESHEVTPSLGMSSRYR
jgi:hypothetical protein